MSLGVARRGKPPIWHCLTHGIPYDEAVHVANRNRALATITAPAA
jgi:hypothetical protein